MLLSLVLSVILLGHPDPYHFEKHPQNVQIIIDSAVEYNEDPFELLAIAITESRLNEKAVSVTGDYGLFQINCKVWWKTFEYVSHRVCGEMMFNPVVNTMSALFIIKTYRQKYKRCQRDGLYLCYNGGPWWMKSKNRERIERYHFKVRQRKWLLKKKYHLLIQGVMNKQYNLIQLFCSPPLEVLAILQPVMFKPHISQSESSMSLLSTN